jgi:excisionase family DNA binding protein
MDRILLTPLEAARALGIGRSKLYELLRSGALPSVRIGACRRIPVDSLTAYVAVLQRTAVIPRSP